MDEKRAEFFNDFRGEIFCACGGTGVEQDQIVVAGGFFHAGADGVEIVCGDGETRRLGAHGFDLRGQHKRVVFEDVAALQLGADGDEFGPGREDGDPRTAAQLSGRCDPKPRPRPGPRGEAYVRRAGRVESPQCPPPAGGRESRAQPRHESGSRSDDEGRRSGRRSASSASVFSMGMTAFAQSGSGSPVSTYCAWHGNWELVDWALMKRVMGEEGPAPSVSSARTAKPSMAEA